MSNRTPLPPNYSRMCALIDECHSARWWTELLDGLSPDEQMQVCLSIIRRGSDIEHALCEIRMRAEHGLNVLSRDLAGLPPKSKRDAKWLAHFKGGDS